MNEPKTLAEAIALIATIRTEAQAKDTRIAELEASLSKEKEDGLSFVAENDNLKTQVAALTAKVNDLTQAQASMFTAAQVETLKREAITSALAANSTPPIDEDDKSKKGEDDEDEKKEEDEDEDDEEKKAVKGLTGIARTAASINFRIKRRK
jgi:alcohol dehydrogenase class IV